MQWNSKLSSSVSAFLNQYQDVRSTSITPVTIVPFYFANNLEGSTNGLELSGNLQVSEAWSLHAGYTLLKEHLHVKPGDFDLSQGLKRDGGPAEPGCVALLAESTAPVGV